MNNPTNAVECKTCKVKPYSCPGCPILELQKANDMAIGQDMEYAEEVDGWCFS